MNSKKNRGRPQKNTSQLSKEKIIKIAKNLTLKNGKIPSIRFLASILKSDPMTIYYYFENKASLLEAVSISLIDDLYIPDPKILWKENIYLLANSYIKLLLKYPDLLAIILSNTTNGAAFVFCKRFNLCIENLDLSGDKKETIINLFVDYIHGFCYAVSCNQSNKKITLNMASKQLNFIIDHIKD